MIIVRLEGGLGNQMFQYAVGRRLSIHYNVPLALDISAYTTSREAYLTPRNYELGIFNLPVTQIKTHEQLHKYYLYPRTFWERMVGKVNRLIDHFNVVYESNTKYSNNLLHAGSNCYLIGYWQNEKYFSEIRSILLQDFSFPYTSQPELTDILKEIWTTNSISVHVRRGDYVSNPIFANRYYACEQSYYQEAISLITQKTSESRFFIFSDEPEWIRHHFNFISDYKIVHFEDPGLDMYLMSQCKHNIIANSSYSWWAAWLNQNKAKQVIAPRFWFKDKDNNPASKEWILI